MVSCVIRCEVVIIHVMWCIVNVTLRYDMLRNVMLCYGMLCYSVMLGYVMSCYIRL